MAYTTLLILGFIAIFASLSNWRSGLLWMIVLACVQDPLRKLIPGTPGILLLIMLVVVLAAGTGMLSSIRRPWMHFIRLHFSIQTSINNFILSIIPPLFISLTYGPGSWAFTIYGLVSYGIILLSVLYGYFYARSPVDIRWILGFYCLVTSLALTGTFLEYYNLEILSNILGDDSLGFNWIRYGSGYTVNLLTGFYRSPDVMGWHASAASMISLTLIFTDKGAGRWRWLAVTSIGIAALMISGRRKMVFMIPLFVILIAGLMIYCRRRGVGLKGIVPLAIPVVIALIVGNWLGEESEFIRYYIDESKTLNLQAQKHLWDSVLDTFRQSGFWGSGFGFASPGAQYIPYDKPELWQESGASRLMVELGLPGMLTFMILIYQFFRSTLRTARLSANYYSRDSMLCICLLAFVLANLCSLGISGQILADPFVASFIGITLGMQLSFARMSGLPNASIHMISKPYMVPAQTL